MQQTDVLIVGGGPTGLVMALLLERFGIDCAVVERSPATTDHPKSRACWTRTMEIFRQWGIEGAIRARGLPEGSDTFAYVDSIAGVEYGRTTVELDLGQTPSWKCIVAQDAVEEVVFTALAGAKFAKVHFSTEFLSLAQHADHVVAECAPAGGGPSIHWRAKYVIAADGAGSGVRRTAGIEMIGPATLALMANDYWRGDLSRFPAARETAAFFVMPSDPGIPPTVILNTNGRDRWLSVSHAGIEQDDRPDAWRDVQAMTRLQTGVPDLEVEVLNRSTWRMSRQVAETYRQGRVLLVGDAAHRFPPSGGFGLNSGIQDAHNLAWKLAFVLRGWASEKLLDTYTVERRPVAESNADFSLNNSIRGSFVFDAIRSGNPEAIAFRIGDVDNHLHNAGQSLGFAYETGALIPDGTAPRAHDSRIYTPSDRPGHRFGHRWLDPSRKHSTLDWFDKDFTVVAGPLGAEWLEAGRRVSTKLGLPLGLRTLSNPQPSEGFNFGDKGAVLVRPDGHVAWRMPWLAADPDAELGSALRVLLEGV